MHRRPNSLLHFHPAVLVVKTLCSHCKGRRGAELYCKTVANGIDSEVRNASQFRKQYTSKLITRIEFWHLHFLTSGDALWEAMDSMPGVPGVSAPGRPLHKVCYFPPCNAFSSLRCCHMLWTFLRANLSKPFSQTDGWKISVLFSSLSAI